ncbi:MAG TPA: ATP-binding protein [Afifellaceae bacterium]|nr:ATP-binding protein [Afifellaceae bacterium]
MTDWLGTFQAISARSDAGERLLRPQPAWIWSRDGSTLAWANPAGAALLGLSRLDQMADFRLSEGQPLRRDISNIARSLGTGSTLARLRFYRGARTVPLACRCERLRLGEGRTLISVTAMESAGTAAPDDAGLAAFLRAGAGTTYVLDGEGWVVAGGGDADAPDFSALGDAAGVGHQVLADGTPVDFVAVGCDDSRRVLVWAGPVVETPEADSEMADAATGEPAGAERSEPAGGEEPAAAEQDAGASDEGGDVDEEALSRQARILRTALAPDREEKPREADSAWPATLEDLPKTQVRFLWQTDADDRFLFVSPGLEQLVGHASQIVGERWIDVARRMRLDPVGRITHALAARDTWSGFTAWWPSDTYHARIPAELTALPVFAIDQSFQGYRGFGVLKPAEALSAEAFDRRFPGRPEEMPEEEPPVATPSPRLSSPAIVVTDRGGSRVAASGNVVPIRRDIDHLPDFARLSPQERSAFDEIASALRTPHESLRSAAEPEIEDEEIPEADDDRMTETIAVDAEAEDLAEQELPAPQDADEATEAVAEDDGDGYSTDADDPAFLASLPDDDDDYPPDIDETYPDNFEEMLDDAEQTGPPAEGVETTDGDDAGPETPGLFAPKPANDDQAGSAVAAAAPDDDEAGERGGLETVERRIRDLAATLDSAADGVVIVDHAGRIVSLSARANALFGKPEEALSGKAFTDLLSEGSRQTALDYLEGLREDGMASVLNEGCEVTALAGDGEIELHLTMARIGRTGEDTRFGAVLRDISRWKKAEAQLIAGRESAERASAQKSDFLARVSHEIRTPLNAIIGFAEVMIEERFGPVENERYREYLRDIRTSGEHVVSLVNDLLDISKIEAGKLDLTFSAVQLNDLVRECVGLMQPQANRAQVIVRSSLADDLPAIVADPRTMRQVVLNLVSNSVKFTGPGGQVIVSTSIAETGEAVLRVRDTGAGMSEDDLARALEPFRQLSTSRISDENGTGLGLPLTKALVEANRARFSINSARGEGTIVQVTFPATRVLSE